MNQSGFGQSKKARQRRNKKLRDKEPIVKKTVILSDNDKEHNVKKSNNNEPYEGLQIFAISHNIMRIPSGMSIPPIPPTPSLPIQNNSNSRFDKCNFCGTDNPKSRTYCYECNEVLL